MDNSGENSPIHPINTLKKLFWLTVRVRLLLSTWHNQSLYITIGLIIKTFAMVYVNLELLVKKIFAVYWKMVKILVTTKSSCAKAGYFIQKT